MRLHKEHDGPCRHMEGLLNQAADGSSRGLARWYALAHAARCSGCQSFLEVLQKEIELLRRSKSDEPSPEVLARLTAIARQSAQSAEG